MTVEVVLWIFQHGTFMSFIQILDIVELLNKFSSTGLLIPIRKDHQVFLNLIFSFGERFIVDVVSNLIVVLKV